jgi:peptide-methionine (R)-S-oxide reductase
MSEIATLQFDLTPPTDQEFLRLAADLSEDERQLLPNHGEEPPFRGPI